MENKKRGSRNKNYWRGLSAVLLVLVLAFIFSGSLPEKNLSSSKDITEKTVSFINKNILQGQGKALVDSVEEKNGLYSIKLTINGQKLDVYVTNDGKLLFPQAINLDEDLQAKTQKPKEFPKTEKPDVKLFTMSFCPYGNQAEEGIYPIVDLLKENVEIEPHYVIYSNYNGGGPKYCFDNENKYCSMHGIQELNQNVRELCVYKYQKDIYWEFVLSVNEKCSASNVDSCWEDIAKINSIDVEKIKTCQKEEAMDLLKKEAELNEKYDANGSPMLVINGVDYNGGRTPESYKQAICSAFIDKPEKCDEVLGENAASSPVGSC